MDTHTVNNLSITGSPAPKHTLLYRLFYSKWDHHFMNEPHAVFKRLRDKDLKLIRTMSREVGTLPHRLLYNPWILESIQP